MRNKDFFEAVFFASHMEWWKTGMLILNALSERNGDKLSLH